MTSSILPPFYVSSSINLLLASSVIIIMSLNTKLSCLGYTCYKALYITDKDKCQSTDASPQFVPEGAGVAAPV